VALQRIPGDKARRYRDTDTGRIVSRREAEGITQRFNALARARGWSSYSQYQYARKHDPVYRALLRAAREQGRESEVRRIDSLLNERLQRIVQGRQNELHAPRDAEWKRLYARTLDEFGLNQRELWRIAYRSERPRGREEDEDEEEEPPIGAEED
jgi:hypothetical protein